MKGALEIVRKELLELRRSPLLVASMLSLPATVVVVPVVLLAWLAHAAPPQALEFVQPRTVLVWQKKRFRDYWRGLSQKSQPGRPAISKAVRELIRDMWQSNPTWGSPRIVGEFRKLGINVAKSTVEKYRPRVRKPSSPTWKTFLNNHVHDIVACDFFIVPTAIFRVLFVFIMLAHERRVVYLQPAGNSIRSVRV